MTDQQKNELRALIDAYADCVAHSQQIPAACVKTELDKRISEIPAPAEQAGAAAVITSPQTSPAT